MIALSSPDGALVGWLTPAHARILAAELRDTRDRLTREAEAAMRSDTQRWRSLCDEAAEVGRVLAWLRAELADHDAAERSRQRQREQAAERIAGWLTTGVLRRGAATTTTNGGAL